MTYKHEKLLTGERAIIAISHRRGYKYKAIVDGRTGKLHRITAGCRVWYSFEHAFRHYRGEDPKGSAWADNKILPVFNIYDNKGTDEYDTQGLLAGELFKTFLNREEARGILRYLERQVRRNIDKRWRLNQARRVEKMRATRARNKRLGVTHARA